MLYTIRHVTRFRYSGTITESISEVRKQPLTNAIQRLLNFKLTVRPSAPVQVYQDYLNNTIHHFNIPGAHHELTITAEAAVQTFAPPPLPEQMTGDDWQRIDALASSGEGWEMLVPSDGTQPSSQLAALAQSLAVQRRGDPLSLLKELNSALYNAFAYDPDSTNVDSPIDVALEKRRGVCQDYTHIMLALVRNYLHIPCRYVSGYLYHSRADRSSAGATHAWPEVLLPDLGWVGFDPTNDLLAGERHIQVAIGRDYHDVPPTRGVFKGNASSELSVTVRVRQSEESHEVLPDEEHAPAYVATQQELQDQYSKTLLLMMQQQQQQ